MIIVGELINASLRGIDYTIENVNEAIKQKNIQRTGRFHR
jgi:hypothetical protein